MDRQGFLRMSTRVSPRFLQSCCDKFSQSWWMCARKDSASCSFGGARSISLAAGHPKITLQPIAIFPRCGLQLPQHNEIFLARNQATISDLPNCCALGGCVGRVVHSAFAPYALPLPFLRCLRSSDLASRGADADATFLSVFSA